MTVANQTISKNETFIEYVSFTSFAMQDLEFQTPINRLTILAAMDYRKASNEGDFECGGYRHLRTLRTIFSYNV